MLPLVRAIVSDIMSVTRDLRERRERWDLLERQGADDPYLDEIRDMQQTLEEQRSRCQQELEELQVELKDPLHGRVDFRAAIQGRDVYLCWQYGEAEIEHWHELDTGFAGRLPLFAASMTTDAFDTPQDHDTPQP